MTVPHLPWTPSATQEGRVDDGPFEVDGLPHMQFRAENWKFGGCTFFAVCTDCNKDAEAGGLIGRNKVIRWGVLPPVQQGGEHLR